MASPVTGGGIQVPHLPQLFILAHRNGAQTQEAFATTVEDLLKAYSYGLLRGGVKVDAQDASDLVRSSAQRFLRHDLPLLKALQVFEERTGG